jgi:hypothetical protein
LSLGLSLVLLLNEAFREGRGSTSERPVRETEAHDNSKERLGVIVRPEPVREET